MKPKLTLKGMFKSEKEQKEKLKQERKRGDIITSIDYALEPTDRFYPTEMVLRQYPTPTERINQLLMPPLESVGVRKRSSTSSNKEESSGKIPIDIITADQLKYILELNGLPVLLGNDIESKRMNYTRALTAGLIPDLPALIPKSEILAMSVPELQKYLSDRGMTGRRGGDPLKQTDKSMLLLMYDKYASPELRGSGGSSVEPNPNDLSGYRGEPLSSRVPDIKTRFAIIDGEIQAGNNAPQLIRDARKLLKEMVTQKMVTLYEAQTHLKHLRKMNKI
jgi:hypothetical protein